MSEYGNQSQAFKKIQAFQIWEKRRKSKNWLRSLTFNNYCASEQVHPKTWQDEWYHEVANQGRKAKRQFTF